MSTPERILRSGDASTPVESAPLPLPRRSPRDHQSPAKATDNVVPPAAKEKGEANKKKRPAASCRLKHASPTKKWNKKSAEESSKKEKRQANFSQDEDFMLCCAYVNVSVDPIVGVGQKAETFWTRVLEKYLLLTEKHLSDSGAELPVRNTDLLQQLNKKKIGYSMQLWNKFYRQINKAVKRSGWNEDNYVDEASKLYKEETGKSFGLDKCVVVLRKLPKFDPMLSGTEDSSPPAVVASAVYNTSDDEDDVEDTAETERNNRSSTGFKKKRKVNNSEPEQGSKVSRPIGMKKAKKLAKLEAKRSRSVRLTATGVVNELATVTKELVPVFKSANAALKQQDIEARRDKKWMKMAEMYFKVGEKEKGMAIVARIEEADEGKHTSATVQSTTITVPGNIAIQECAPDDDMLLGNHSDEDDTDDDSSEND